MSWYTKTSRKSFENWKFQNILNIIRARVQIIHLFNLFWILFIFLHKAFHLIYSIFKVQIHIYFNRKIEANHWYRIIQINITNFSIINLLYIINCISFLIILFFIIHYIALLFISKYLYISSHYSLLAMVSISFWIEGQHKYITIEIHCYVDI